MYPVFSWLPNRKRSQLAMNVHIVQILILSLALMHIHYDMELNLDKMINIFARKHLCHNSGLLIVMLRL